MKTLAIRLEDEQHARLSVLAKVSGDTVTDLIRSAIDARLTELTNDAGTAAKAKAVLEELERQVSAERDAIAALIGDDTPAPKRSTTGTRNKGNSPAA